MHTSRASPTARSRSRNCSIPRLLRYRKCENERARRIVPMNAPIRRMPWIGGAADAPSAKFSQLVSPIDETVASEIVESDAAVVDAAVKHAHAAYLKHFDAATAKRIEWLLAAA